MTGGAGAGTLIPSETLQYPFPPITLEAPSIAASFLPSYTSTGAISTLPAPTYTNSKGSTISAGDGWFNTQDILDAPTPIAGCAYPNAWDAISVTLPSAVVCGGAAGGASVLTPVTSISAIGATTRPTAITTTAIIPTATTATATTATITTAAAAAATTATAPVGTITAP
jgi:glucan 1,3-beta-glucosidase